MNSPKIGLSILSEIYQQSLSIFLDIMSSQSKGDGTTSTGEWILIVVAVAFAAYVFLYPSTVEPGLIGDIIDLIPDPAALDPAGQAGGAVALLLALGALARKALRMQ